MLILRLVGRSVGRVEGETSFFVELHVWMSFCRPIKAIPVEWVYYYVVNVEKKLNNSSTRYIIRCK